jgi:disulfide bond formation protein DsbB
VRASRIENPLKSEAYKLGGGVLFAAVAIIATALAFEYIGGYLPCPLCLQQRYAYYAAIPLLFIALVLVSAEKRAAAALLFLFVGLAFLANSGLGVYQAGAEWGFWPGPESCAAAGQGVTAAGANMLEALKSTRVVSCTDPAFRLAGLSFAGWNAVVSLLLAIAALKAAFAANEVY